MHLVFIAIALTITLVGLEFWANFGNAMHHFNDMKAAAGQNSDVNAYARAKSAQDGKSGVVTMTIVPGAAQKPACDKKHPCP
jgi:hypothetical protein